MKVQMAIKDSWNSSGTNAELEYSKFGGVERLEVTIPDEDGFRTLTFDADKIEKVISILRLEK